jgi:acetyl-CoA carboxylase carboxyltransferase component
VIHWLNRRLPPPSAAPSTIMPHQTRRRIACALAMLRGKKVEMPGRKHDNLLV